MTRGRVIGLGVLLVLIAFAIFHLGTPAILDEAAPPGVSAAGGEAARPRVIIPGPWPKRTPAEVIRATPPGVLRYAERLNSPTESAQDDVRLLVSLLELYRHLSHRTNPVGNNAEITAFLTGKNPMGYAFIRPDSPAINGDGELCDRWGTPYYFHQVSGTVMEVRSAGPDRQHWTGDDVIAAP